ncbi:MAG: DUF4412 domain-containing protein [bacterium]
MISSSFWRAAPRRAAIGVFALLLAAPAAQAFDGTVKLRTMSLTKEDLAKANGGKAPDTAATLALMPAQLDAMKDLKPESRESTVYVSGSKVRMEAPLNKGKTGYAIVDLTKGTTWLVVPDEKRYIEWSPDDAKAMADKMVEVRKMLKERMSQLPPEQQKQAEEMMKNMDQGDKPAPPIDVKALGKSAQLNGMETSAFEAKDGDATVVGWVTQDQPDLAKALREVSDRMEKMTPPAMRKPSVRTAFQAKGFPVLVQTVEGDRYRIEEVLAVDKKPVSADLFVVPKDYAKTTGREALKNVPTNPPPK